MLKEIDIKELSINPFTSFGINWALITAGNQNGFNTMTASWGQMGVLWNKNIITIFVRPQRYTHEFMEEFDNFTVSFYGEDMREALTYCGRHSGRDEDKVKACGLTPISNQETTYFKDAKLVFKCKKIYKDEIRPNNFIDSSIDNQYPNEDYHTVYIGEITQILINE